MADPGAAVKAREPGAAPARLYAERRARVLAALGEHAAMIVVGATEIVVGRDTELRYQVDPELYWLTGYVEPDAVAVLCPSHDKPFTLFVRPRDEAREQWTGPRGGPDAAVERFGADAAFPIAELAERLPKIVGGIDVLHARIDSGRESIDAIVRKLLVDARRTRPRSGKGAHTLVDPGIVLDEMRVCKDAHELALLRQAAAISVAGFLDACTVIRPGAGEWEVEAALEAGFRRRGGDGYAFPSIVATGVNATVLHYRENDARLRSGHLLLIDAGARYRHYCADISRTFPVNGRFTPAQRRLYDCVLAARDAVIGAIRPGATPDQLDATAKRVLAEGLIDEGLIEGPLAAALEDAPRVKRFYPHRVGHWLGIEVHDVGAYTFRDGSRPLQAGMVLTVEPGLYIPRADDVPAGLQGTGIRIEDDVLVTADGHDVLTAALPSTPDDVAALTRSTRTP